MITSERIGDTKLKKGEQQREQEKREKRREEKRPDYIGEGKGEREKRDTSESGNMI